MTNLAAETFPFLLPFSQCKMQILNKNYSSAYRKSKILQLSLYFIISVYIIMNL